MTDKTWRIKEFGALAHVSVRTLHHYDRIGLLAPSKRLTNGYRVYTDQDLMRLQQILSLKLFGLELSQIQQLLSGQHDMLALLQMQRILLHEKIQQLSKAEDILVSVMEECAHTASIDLTSTLKLIEVYHMTKELEQTSLAQIFTKEQLKRYAKMPKPTEEESIQYGKDWEALISEVGQHIKEDPYGAIGQAYAKKWMDLVQRWWRKDHDLGITIWDCYRNDSFPKDGSCVFPHIPKDVITWIDQAVYYMYSGQEKVPFNMHKEITQRPEIKLMGIQVRTNNQNERDWANGKVFPCVQRYFQEALAQQTRGRVQPGTTFCAYTDYESDVNGDYTYFIGEEVSSFDSVPEGFTTLTIPAQTYAKFTTEPGPMPGVVRNAWGTICQMTPEKLGGARAYLTDFEIYDERASDPTHQSIVLDVYIGIKR